MYILAIPVSADNFDPDIEKRLLRAEKKNSLDKFYSGEYRIFFLAKQYVKISNLDTTWHNKHKNTGPFINYVRAILTISDTPTPT